jgi:isocitrate dehydrogenase
MSKPTIIWSKIDEAPALATYSLLPIVEKFTNAAGVDVKQSDISLAARVLAAMGLEKMNWQNLESLYLSLRRISSSFQIFLHL